MFELYKAKVTAHAIFTDGFESYLQGGVMRSLRAAAIVVMVFASTSLLAQSNAQKILDRFKTMVGTWEGKSPDGKTSEVKYQLVAGGTAVMSDNHMIGDDMTSMFYVDGERLMMTHFCPSGNQPRMQAMISPDLKTVSFEFVDATNLAGPQAGHMHRAVYIFSDAGHYSEEWTWRQEGKDAHFHYEMTRK